MMNTVHNMLCDYIRRFDALMDDTLAQIRCAEDNIRSCDTDIEVMENYMEYLKDHRKSLQFNQNSLHEYRSDIEIKLQKKDEEGV